MEKKNTFHSSRSPRVAGKCAGAGSILAMRYSVLTIHPFAFPRASKHQPARMDDRLLRRLDRSVRETSVKHFTAWCRTRSELRQAQVQGKLHSQHGALFLRQTPSVSKLISSAAALPRTPRVTMGLVFQKKGFFCVTAHLCEQWGCSSSFSAMIESTYVSCLSSTSL